MNLLLGNEAVALGALAGGVRFFASHPLPPSAEIDLTLLREMPNHGGRAVIVEDEPAAFSAVLGAGAGGSLGVTATTGSGLSRAHELLAHGVGSSLPALVAVVGDRVEASSRVESAGQAELLHLRWGRPGGGSPRVFAPASAAECFDLARAGAALATRERTPVLVYLDDLVAHLREPVATDPRGDAAASNAEVDPAPPSVDLYRARDASVLIVAVGIVARAARTAVRLARERGIRAGLFRPVTLWPFPARELREASSRCRSLLVVELNEGQLAEVVTAQAAAGGPVRVSSLADPAIGMWTPARILQSLEESA